MKIQEIKEVIKAIIKGEIDCKSALIDGPWGCGKTTAIKSAIAELTEDDISKRNIIYQSLFGIKDVSELAACFSHAGKIIYSLARSIASPFTKLIPIVGDSIKESIDNSTALFTPSPSQKKNVVFIFDDLERVDESLSYITLLGFFNQLIMRGCKIICVSSLTDLSKIDINRKNGLDAFLEKAFDRIMYINETPEEAIVNIFNDNEKTKLCIGQCLDMFDSNIRIAIKTHRLLLDVFKKANEHEYDLSRKYNDLQIMKAAIFSIKAINHFNAIVKEETNKKEKEEKTYLNLLFDNESSQLNPRVKDNIKQVLTDGSSYYLPEEKNDIMKLAICFCSVDVHDDYSGLIQCFSQKNEEESIYNTSVFYYDDEGKNEYFYSFKKDTLDGKLHLDRNYIDKLVEIIKYTDSDLNKDGFLDYVILKVIENCNNGDSSAYDRLNDYIHFPDEADNKQIVSELFKKIASKMRKAESDSLEVQMTEAYNENNYRYLLDLLNDVEQFKKTPSTINDIKQHLLKNRFYLPDLSKMLNYESWSYCHQVARISKNDDELSASFINLLKEELKKHKSSKSAVDRSLALLKYNFDSEKYNEFLLFCQQLEKSSNKITKKN